MKIILVCIGNFQEYILFNIENLLLYDNTDIVVITEPTFFPFFSKYDTVKLIDRNHLSDCQFNASSNLDRNFRNGFFHLCSLRLFYLYSYIAQNQIEKCIHIENDVMVYYPLQITTHTPPLFQSDKLCLCFDTPDRVVPSIIYIPKPENLRYVLERYDCNIDDMRNLARFDDCVVEKLPLFHLPGETHEKNELSKNFAKYGVLFDGAAIGQYLGGVDPRNIPGDTRGFVNEECLIKYDGCSFVWKKRGLLYYPAIRVGDKYIRIINLHIHCKQLHRFLANDPLETRFIHKES
jgi:hypothetical protein